jgi:DNA-binding CsgD family transcriptional regulator
MVYHLLGHNYMQFGIMHDVVLQKQRNGVQLVNPLNNRSFVGKSIQSIFAIPCNAFIMSNDDIMLHANEMQLNEINAEYSELIGQPLSYFVSKGTALPILKNNKAVIHNDKIRFINESVRYKNDDITSEGLSVKLPLYDQKQKTIGILGFGINTNKHCLASCLSSLQQAGLLDDTCSSYLSSASLQINGVNLTIRESDCIKLIIRGKTAKEIGDLLGLSNRTVEYYLENIKCKLNVNSRSELIDKVIDCIL